MMERWKTKQLQEHIKRAKVTFVKPKIYCTGASSRGKMQRATEGEFKSEQKSKLLLYTPCGVYYIP